MARNNKRNRRNRRNAKQNAAQAPRFVSIIHARKVVCVENKELDSRLAVELFENHCRAHTRDANRTPCKRDAKRERVKWHSGKYGWYRPGRKVRRNTAWKCDKPKTIVTEHHFDMSDAMFQIALNVF